MLNHPLHPALVHFPIAFWCVATLHDVGFTSGFINNGAFSWYCLILGCASALLTMATGWIDFSKLHTNLHGLAKRHMLLMTSAWMSYLVALMTRTEHGAPVMPTWLSYVCSVTGFVLLLIGAWHGGELVYAHGAAVSTPASTNGPN
ncbi:MAG: DUF2231 domain-containing protein [Steroidobacter sp.]